MDTKIMILRTDLFLWGFIIIISRSTSIHTYLLVFVLPCHAFPGKSPSVFATPHVFCYCILQLSDAYCNMPHITLPVRLPSV